MRVRWTETAFAELGGIHAYIAKDNPAAAKRVVLRIEQVTTRLGRFPGMGSATDSPGVRVFPALPFSYLVFYSIGAEEVIIRNIRHASRRRPP